MLSQFKSWIKEIGDTAIDRKKAAARTKGNEGQWKQEIWGSKDKNAEIKNRFTLEGKSLGFIPRSTEKNREWLYDLTWQKFDNKNNLIGVELAMEIEMSAMDIKGIKYDFDKLLQCDAPYKIMVFQVKTAEEAQQAFERLETAINCYIQKINSEILLCAWITSTNEFEFKSRATVI